MLGEKKSGEKADEMLGQESKLGKKLRERRKVYSEVFHSLRRCHE